MSGASSWLDFTQLRMSLRHPAGSQVSSKAFICEGDFVPEWSAKRNIEVLVAVERRVEVHKVHRLVLDVSPQNVEVVAIIQTVDHHVPA
jgi:hypothetical protein